MIEEVETGRDIFVQTIIISIKFNICRDDVTKI